ncbi:unnamed protein product [Sphagnum troendelagicum]
MRKMKQKTVSQTTTNILLPVMIASHQMIDTMLSEEGPSFDLDNAPGSVSTTVAVTPFKDGKGPPLNGLLVSLPLLSDNVTNTVAVTPMHRFPPPLAPLPLCAHKPECRGVSSWYMWQQFQSLLTFPAIPAYSPIPEIVADADENVSQQQHAGEAAADTEETTGAMRVEKQAAINSACLRISLPI